MNKQKFRRLLRRNPRPRLRPKFKPSHKQSEMKAPGINKHSLKVEISRQ